MRSKIVEFLHGESGAVTADWVVLTGMIVGLVLGFSVIFGDDIWGASINVMEKTGDAALASVDI